jgi:hypothetical protein
MISSRVMLTMAGEKNGVKWNRNQERGIAEDSPAGFPGQKQVQRPLYIYRAFCLWLSRKT